MITLKESRNMTFILISYNFCISTPFLTLEMVFFMIHNWQVDETIRDPIQPPIVYVKLEVSIIGPRTLHDFVCLPLPLPLPQAIVGLL